MLSAFLVLPHSRLSLSSPRLVEAWPVQPPPLVWLACRLGNRPAGRIGDWRPVALSGLPPAGLPHTRIRLRKKKRAEAGRIIPPHMEAVCLIGGYLPKPPNPLGSFTCRMQARTNPPHYPRLHPARKRLPFRRIKTAFYKSARCTIVRQSNLAPLLRSRRGNPKRPLQPPGAKASLPRSIGVVFVVQKHKLAAYL